MNFITIYPSEDTPFEVLRVPSPDGPERDFFSIRIDNVSLLLSKLQLLHLRSILPQGDLS